MSRQKDYGRGFFPELLTKRNLLGRGVEVGVFRGWHSKLILDNWKGKKVYAVDPWEEPPRKENRGYASYYETEPGSLEIAYEAAVVFLKPYGARCEIIKKPSLEASRLFEDESLDWVYIDGRHYKEGVQEDLECWYPKVVGGGIVAGHDFCDIPERSFEVKQTVLDFFRPLDLKVIEVKTKDMPSWYVIKESK